MKGKKESDNELKAGSKLYKEIGELTEMDYYCSKNNDKKQKK